MCRFDHCYNSKWDFILLQCDALSPIVQGNIKKEHIKTSYRRNYSPDALHAEHGGCGVGFRDAEASCR